MSDPIFGNGETERYPLDFEALRRGSVITADELKRIFNIDPDNAATVAEGVKLADDLRMKVLGLKEEIEGYFRDVRQEVATVSTRNGELRVLTASEQDADVLQRYRKAARQYGSALARDVGNDIAALTDEQREGHRKRIPIESWRLQQLRKRPPPELTTDTEA